jgi:hypothetical protein
VIVTYSQSQSFTRFPKENFSREDWNTKAAAIHNMGDDSTPIDSRQDAGDDSQRAPVDGDDGHIGDGGAEYPEEVLPNVMVEEAINVETESAADQQVQHLSHFLFISVISYFFYLSHFFTLPLHQVPGSTTGDTTGVVGEVVVEAEKYPAAEQQVRHLSHFFVHISYFFMISISLIFVMFLPQFFGSDAGDSATQSSASWDNFVSIIKDVIRGLEDDPTQMELRADASRVEERSAVVA